MQDEDLDKIKNEYSQVRNRADFNSETDTEEDIKQKDINYKDYLNEVIQEYNMLEKSKKYLANDLANQGLASQGGYSSSQQIQMDANMRNQYAQAKSNYEDKQLQVDKERQDQILADNQAMGQTLTGLITGIQDNEDLTENAINDKIGEYLTNYGFDTSGLKDDKGNWDFDKLNDNEKFAALDENTKGNILTAINDTKFKGDAEKGVKDLNEQQKIDMQTRYTEYFASNSSYSNDGLTINHLNIKQGEDSFNSYDNQISFVNGDKSRNGDFTIRFESGFSGKYELGCSDRGGAGNGERGVIKDMVQATGLADGQKEGEMHFVSKGDTCAIVVWTGNCWRAVENLEDGNKAADSAQYVYLLYSLGVKPEQITPNLFGADESPNYTVWGASIKTYSKNVRDQLTKLYAVRGS